MGGGRRRSGTRKKHAGVPLGASGGLPSLHLAEDGAGTEQRPVLGKGPSRVRFPNPAQPHGLSAFLRNSRVGSAAAGVGGGGGW